jgi:predicted ATPase
MLVRHLSIKNLHGYMNKEIEFLPDINLVVGINGSGKTSVLNVVSWLLQPSIAHLCMTEFSEITLDFLQDEVPARIRCTQTDTEFRLYLEGEPYVDFKPLVVQLARPAASIRTAAEREDIYGTYKSLRPDINEQKTWAALRRIPSPIVVGLERTLRSDQLELHVSQSKAPSLGISPEMAESAMEMPPLRRVQQLASEAYSRYRTQLIRINDDLRDNVMLAAFDIGEAPVAKKRRRRKDDVLTDAQIEALEQRVSRYFAQEAQGRRVTSKRKTQDRTAVAKSYFDRLRKLLDLSKGPAQTASNEALWDVISGQFRKMNQLFAEFESFDRKSERAYDEIRRYLATLNRFLKDSAKRLSFKPDSSALGFEIVNATGRPDGVIRSVESLSSGEKQILILFTYLAFSRGKIFIIDGPEISLHPKWQEEFLKGVKELMPSRTQLIIATHSPAIVGRNIEYCKTLLPYNQ